MAVLENTMKIGSIQGGQLDAFQSAEITGTGSLQTTAHGLGRTPVVVLGYLTQKNTTTAFDLILGTADATNVEFNVETTAKYRVLAF